MPKASEIAAELRKVAASLEQEPEAEVTRPLCFFYADSTEELATLGRILPHPLSKFFEEYEYGNAGFEYDNGAAWIRACVDRKMVCERIQVGTKVEPAAILPAREETFVPEREVPVYEYRCGSFMRPSLDAIETTI